MGKTQRPSGASAATFVVRIYRVDQGRRGGVVGVVETVGEDVKTAFTNVDELWSILTAKRPAGAAGPTAQGGGH